MEIHLGKNHKVLFIWNEEIDAPLPVHKDTNSIQYLIFFIYIFFLPLMLSDLLSFSSYSTPTSDLHTTWIDSTFSTCLRTQLQNRYFDALNDP